MTRPLSFRLTASLSLVAIFATQARSAATEDVPPTPSTIAQGVYLAEPEPVPPPTVVGSGELVEKYENGSKRIERQVTRFSDDQIVNNGTYTEYYLKGQKFCEGVYNQGVHDGTWTFWYDNGQLAKKVTFVDGMADGTWDVFRADGTLLMHKTYKRNRRDGQWTKYHPDGKTPLIEDTYVDGKQNGVRTTYHANGRKNQQSNFVDGVLDGPMTQWDESGRKVAEVVFDKGRVNGQVIRWGDGGTEQESSTRSGVIGFDDEEKKTPPSPSEPQAQPLPLSNVPK